MAIMANPIPITARTEVSLVSKKVQLRIMTVIAL
jgi:hypothetical protein